MFEYLKSSLYHVLVILRIVLVMNILKKHKLPYKYLNRIIKIESLTDEQGSYNITL